MRLASGMIKIVLLSMVFAPHARGQEAVARNAKALEFPSPFRAWQKAESPIPIIDQSLFVAAFPKLREMPGTPDELAASKESILSSLSNHDVSIQSYYVESEGKLSALPGNVAAKRKQVVVEQDYEVYRLVEVGSVTKRIGVVFRVRVELFTKRADVNLNGLFSIGLAVREGSATGNLHVSVYGLAGEPISSIIPLPSEVSESSLQQAMQAVATLKALMHDSRVYVVPQVIAERART